MKCIWPDKITSVSATSENSQFPADNVMDDHPQKRWKGTGDTETLTLSVGPGASALMIGNTNATSVDVTMNGADVLVWEEGEPERTNYLLYSEQLDNAAWTKTRVTVTANAAAGPDGRVVADKLIEDTSTNSHYSYQSVAGVPDSATVSYWAELAAAERTVIALWLLCKDNTSAVCYVDLTTGTQPALVTSGYTATVTAIDGGFWKVSLEGSAKSGATNVSARLLMVKNGATNYTGDGVSGVLVAHQQLEIGSPASGKITTTSAAVTRLARPEWESATEWEEYLDVAIGTLDLTVGSPGEMWMEYTEAQSAHEIHVSMTCPAGEVCYAGVAKAGPLNEFRDPVYGLTEGLKDYSIVKELNNGAIYTKKKNVVRSFAGTVTLERDPDFYGLMSIFQEAGPEPFPWRVVSSSTSREWIVYARKESDIDGKHDYPGWSTVNFSLIEVV